MQVSPELYCNWFQKTFCKQRGKLVWSMMYSSKQSDLSIKMLALGMKKEEACIQQTILPSAYEKLTGLGTLA